MGNDNQPRDDRGRWTGDGGGTGAWAKNRTETAARVPGKYVVITPHGNSDHPSRAAARRAAADYIAKQGGTGRVAIAPKAYEHTVMPLPAKLSGGLGGKRYEGPPGSVSPARAEDVGVKVKLPEKHENYFKVDANTKSISLDKITPTRARPEGIRHAEVKMIHAYNSGGPKREPISLEHQGNGTYKVMDGNSTFAIASKHGWSTIAANVWEKGQWKDPKKH